MSGVVSTDVGARFLEALERRDYEALGCCFSSEATLRSIVPPGLREDDGRDAIAARFRLWTEGIDGFEVLQAASEPYADMLRLCWAVTGFDPNFHGGARATFEQTAYAELDDGLITAMRLACSGRRPAV